MPVKTQIWKIGQTPTMLKESQLTDEKSLQEMIKIESAMLSDEWLLIGEQVRTDYDKRIDLLGIAPDGSLVIIELKRDRTPREVVAQALDYASWVENLTYDRIVKIYAEFTNGKKLADAFRDKFGQSINSDEVNQSHQIVIVAARLDDSTERIVNYLSQRDIPINVLFFQVFANGDEALLSRAWLLDPIHTQLAATTSSNEASEPWNGEFYCSFGHGESRSWSDAHKYGFISGGGGSWYSRTLKMLNVNDRVWVRIPGEGFIGVARVLGKAIPASEFRVQTAHGERPVLEVVEKGHYHKHFVEDEERCEYFVPVTWLDAFDSIEQAIHEEGMFGNTNTICKPKTPKWSMTVERLKEFFPNFDDSAG